MSISLHASDFRLHFCLHMLFPCSQPILLFEDVHGPACRPPAKSATWRYPYTSISSPVPLSGYKIIWSAHSTGDYFWLIKKPGGFHSSGGTTIMASSLSFWRYCPDISLATTIPIPSIYSTLFTFTPAPGSPHSYQQFIPYPLSLKPFSCPSLSTHKRIKLPI